LCLLLNRIALLFCPGEAWETFQIFSRTYTQNSRTFKDFPGQQKKSRTFPGCGNPEASFDKQTKEGFISLKNLIFFHANPKILKKLFDFIYYLILTLNQL